jgi:hypothetical protein
VTVVLALLDWMKRTWARNLGSVEMDEDGHVTGTFGSVGLDWIKRIM